GKDRPRYILQRINQTVFRAVPALMENIVRVTAHLRGKQNPGSELRHDVLTVIPAADGRYFYHDEKGDYWRCYVFIRHHRSYDRVPGPKLAREGGKVFGAFLNSLADLPGPPLHETIAAFHDPETHLQRFDERVAEDPGQRAAAAAAEIAFVQVRRQEMKRIQRLAEAGKIPRRVTHNDTKFNNILFDEQGRGLCVIDLDTVMPGYVHYDFGDAVRSGCNPAGEDALDLETVHIDLDLFKAFAEGFLLPLRETLNECEMAHLAFAAKLFAFQVGLRFLSDHLAGDGYFKIAYPGHNLQRARVQFRLLASMEKHFARMEDIIGALAGAGPEKC
ncbi:MAG TPA: aminoglycoside phosphotransferase family protein, partial [Candidatus Binatia bacterium]|nr:aminoglycoside phosphotransferase family protein [Candidatus Binatia bacterium]